MNAATPQIKGVGGKQYATIWGLRDCVEPNTLLGTPFTSTCFNEEDALSWPSKAIHPRAIAYTDF